MQMMDRLSEPDNSKGPSCSFNPITSLYRVGNWGWERDSSLSYNTQQVTGGLVYSRLVSPSFTFQEFFDFSMAIKYSLLNSINKTKKKKNKKNKTKTKKQQKNSFSGLLIEKHSWFKKKNWVEGKGSNWIKLNSNQFILIKTFNSVHVCWVLSWTRS